MNQPVKKIHAYWTLDQRTCVFLIDHGHKLKWQLIKWQVGSDQVERGQWLFKRKIYPHFSSLSEDGEFFVHYQYSPLDGDYGNAIVLSRPPFFTALSGCVLDSLQRYGGACFHHDTLIIDTVKGSQQTLKKKKKLSPSEIEQQRLLAKRDLAMTAMCIHFPGGVVISGALPQPPPRYLRLSGVGREDLPILTGTPFHFVDGRLMNDTQIIFNPYEESFQAISAPYSSTT